MFELQNRGAVNININGLTLTRENFIYVKILQRADQILPAFELMITVPNLKILPEISKNNTPITISFGQNIQEIKDYDFLINNFSIIPKVDKYEILMSGVLDMIAFYTELKQTSAKDVTTDAMLGQLANITTDIQYVGNDSQTWIRHNISEKDWVRRLLKNSYISDSSFPLAAYTIDKKLIVKDVAKAFGSTPKYTFYNQPMGNSSQYIRYDKMVIESDYGIGQAVLGGGRELSVYNMVTNETKEQLASGGGVTGTNLDMLSNNRPIPTLFDTSNVHDNFYTGELNNLSLMVNLFSINIFIDLNDRLLDEKEYPLLTMFKIRMNETSDSIDDIISGNYMLTEKSLFIDSKTLTQRFRLNRDYPNE